MRLGLLFRPGGHHSACVVDPEFLPKGFDISLNVNLLKQRSVLALIWCLWPMY